MNGDKLKEEMRGNPESAVDEKPGCLSKDLETQKHGEDHDALRVEWPRIPDEKRVARSGSKFIADLPEVDFTEAARCSREGRRLHFESS